jgi:chlorobactene glucosyltransferase
MRALPHIMDTVLTSIWLASVAWLIFRAFRQRGALAQVAPIDAAGRVASVVIIVPARNESQNIEACVKSLLGQQQYPWTDLHVLVVDDGSIDNTAAIVEELAGKSGQRMTLLRAPELLPGWKGKGHACWLGAEAARARFAPEWLCFLDADMRAGPLLMCSAIEAAARGDIDLLSLAPRHELLSVAERLILPCGLYLLGFSQDLKRIQAPDSGDVVATGQFMLVRRAAYEQTGGHAAVRGAICEDLELARLFKRLGHRVLLQDGSRVLTARMYTGWRTLWPGIAKNLTETLGGPLRTLVTAAVAVLMAWAALLLPLAEGIECHHGAAHACIALGPALLGSAALIALHIGGAIHFGIPVWYGLLFPLGYTTGALLALDSVRWRLRGRVVWKGRIYQ